MGTERVSEEYRSGECWGCYEWVYFDRPMNVFGIISKICLQDGVKVIIKTH